MDPGQPGDRPVAAAERRPAVDRYRLDGAGLLGGHPLDDDRSAPPPRREESRPVWALLPVDPHHRPRASPCCCWWQPTDSPGTAGIAWIAGLVTLEQYLVTLRTWLRWPLAVFLLMLRCVILPDVEHGFRFITLGLLSVIAWIAGLAYGFMQRTSPTTTPCTAASGGSSSSVVLLPVGGSGAVRRRTERGDREHHSEDGKDPGEPRTSDNDDPELRLSRASASLSRPCRWRAGTDTARGGPGGPACSGWG